MLLAAVGAAMLVAAIPATASAKYSVPYGNTALGDAIWNETWEPESVAGANNGCKPSSAHPYPVVLVHATLADEGSNWVTLAPLLANEGYCVYAFNYGATLASLELWPFIGPRIDGLGHIESSAKELSSFVNNVLSKTKASKVDLVGHSQGGMMPNYYIKYLGGASKVNELIGLAPSNHGTTLDGLTKFVENFPFATELVTGLLEFLGAPSLPEQTENSAFIKKLFGSGEPVVVGRALRGDRDRSRRGRHALHARVPERLERDQHHRSRASARAIRSRTSACSTTRRRCRTCSTSSARARTRRSKPPAATTGRGSRGSIGRRKPEAGSQRAPGASPAPSDLYGAAPGLTNTPRRRISASRDTSG